jgi:hypothetical protein
MLLSEAKTTKEQGNIGIGEAISYFCREGITVSIPLNDTQPYDLVVELNGELKKVQVRTTTQISRNGNNDKYEVGLRKTSYVGNGKFETKSVEDIDYDYLFALTNSDKKYFIPTEVIKGIKSAITVGKNSKYEKYLV